MQPRTRSLTVTLGLCAAAFTANSFIPGSAFTGDVVLSRLASPAAAQQSEAAALPSRSVRRLSKTVIAFEQRGYVVRSAEDDGRTHEIEAITPDGRRIEAVVEAATGEVLIERADD
jgi:hypothetical protein